MEKEQYLKISRPQNVCVSCGVPIADAGKHPSAIASPEEKAESDDPVRRDFCPQCWESIRDKDYFSFWLARREKPKPRKIEGRKQRNATLLSYFDYLYEKKDPEYAQHLFFLAHMLMKFSVLRWVRTLPPASPEEAERIVFKNTVTDDLLEIENVVLEDERVATIKKEIDEFLHRAANPEESAEQP